MKSMLLSAVLATAAATAPPRIELDLSAMSNAVQLTNSIHRTHDLNLKQPDGTAVGSRQDWTERCAAKASTHTSCPFPTAAAFDHQDSEVPVTTRVFLVDLDGTTENTAVDSVNFNQRSTYLFKYDAHDRAGNHAEQVVFALILDDITAPTITLCNGAAETVEAASSWTLCGTSVADDNVDGTSIGIKYTVEQVSSGTKMVTEGTYLEAKAAITTHVVGEFLVTLHTHDNAGIYGTNGQDNAFAKSKSVLVKDTRPPYIDMHGSVGGTHECAQPYVDGGATATDLLDTEALGQDISVVVDSTICGADNSGVDCPTREEMYDGNTPEGPAVGHYTVTYNAADYAGNAATTQVRNVEVTDTTIPIVQLTTTVDCGENCIHRAGEQFSDPGATCRDKCDQTAKEITMAWSRPWNATQLGDYIRTYTCCDASDNCGTNTRKFTLIDESQPELTIVDAELLTVEASNSLEYTDSGATCEDYVDGSLSHAVEVSGQVVNMRVPGTYVIRYDCQDLSGNAAAPVNRTVVVQDTIKPQLTLQGHTPVYVEAGFPYVDAGATATDDLDGEITSKVWTDGDTVDTSNAFYSMRSCQAIKNAYSGAKDGIYYITTYAQNQYTRQLVWCDMQASEGYTYLAVICGTRVVPYNADGNNAQGDCPNYGLEMAKFADSAARDRAVSKFQSVPDANSVYFPTGTATTDYYLCSTNDHGADANMHTFDATSTMDKSNHHRNLNDMNAQTVTSADITRAEAGKYVIFYHVSDNAGNKEEATIARTVIVKDTLPPVISLHIEGHNNAGSDAAHVSDGMNHNGMTNPASYAPGNAPDAAHPNEGNPYLAGTHYSHVANSFLMAEQSVVSTNAWIVGAVASAATGLALIAYGNKQ